MRKFLLVLVVLLLVGCSVRPIEFDRAYPNTSKIDVVKVEKQKMRESSGGKNKFNFLIGTQNSPDRLMFLIPDFDTGYSLLSARQCWALTFEECDFVKPVDIFNRLGFDVHYATLPANRVSKISTFSLLTYGEELPYPDRLEWIVYNDDGTYTSTPLKKLSKDEFEFTTPAEGTQKIFIKAIFEEYVKGIALYPIVITAN